MKSTLTELNEERWMRESSDWRGYFKSGEELELDGRVRKTVAFLPESCGGLLLDVGCSDGVLTKVASDKTGASLAAGVDITHLKEAVKNGVSPVSFDLNSSLHLPFADESFSVLVCGGTLEHLLDTDHALTEMRRVLKTGGVAVFSVPRIDSLLSITLLALGFQPPSIECSPRKRYGTINKGSQVSGHVSHYTKKALVEMIADHGFSVSDYAESGIYSSWLLAQKAARRKPGIGCLMLRLFDMIPFKKDVCVVRAEKI